MTLLLALGVLAAAVFLIIPELGRSLRTLADSIPGFIARAQAWLTELAQKYPQWQDWINDLQLDWNAIARSCWPLRRAGRWIYSTPPSAWPPPYSAGCSTSSSA
ncbi:MAG: hypothetical protein ACLU9S_04225 [Oscillospiraceae bacterium]